MHVLEEKGCHWGRYQNDSTDDGNELDSVDEGCVNEED